MPQPEAMDDPPRLPCFPLRDLGPLAEAWRRFLAAAIDTAILFVLQWLAVALTTSFWRTDPSSPAFTFVYPICVWLIVWAVWRTGSSPGKRLVGIEIVARDGSSMDGKRALRRVFGFIVACLPLRVGLLPIITHPMRQGWHDQLAGTIVVKRGRRNHLNLPPPEPVRAAASLTVPDIRYALRGILLPIVAYLALDLLATWPLAAHFRTAMVGNAQDNCVFAWDIWFVSFALSHHLPIDRTNLLFYPQTTPLYLHTMDWFNSVLGAALIPRLGLLATYNTLFIASLVASQTSCYVLVAALTRNRVAAFMVSVAFGLASVFCGQMIMGHINLVSAEFLPLYALCLQSALAKQRWSWAVGAGVAMAFAGLCDFQYVLFCILVAAGFGFGIASRWPQTSTTELARSAGIIVSSLIVGALILSPMVFHIVQLSHREQYPTVGPEAAHYRADFISFVEPNPCNWLLRNTPITRHDPAFTSELIVSTSWTVIALCVWGILRGRFDRRIWVGVTLTAIVLAMGAEFTFQHQPPNWIAVDIALGFPGNGFDAPWNFGSIQNIALNILSGSSSIASYATGVSLPFFWLQHHVPMLSSFRTPVRFALVVCLGTSVLSGIGLASVLDRVARRRGQLARVAAATIVMAALCCELSPCPVGLYYPPVSPFYAVMAADPTPYAVIDMPLGSYEPYDFDQAMHHKAMFRGCLSRVPYSAEALIRANAFLQYCERRDPRHPEIPSTDAPPDLPTFRRDLEALRRIGTRYVIVHKRVYHTVPADVTDLLANKLQLPVVANDRFVTVYEIVESHR